ncbi:MAG TPA: pilin [Candidatus Saccharimonadales bacterium]|nr:pilin [Candidatus Saccharimonadales bacterium]
MQKLKKLLLIGFMAGLTMLPVFAGVTNVASAAANAKQEICEGLGGSGSCTVSGQPSINATIKKIIDIFSAIAGIAAVIMIIVAGFRFITANGDSGTVSSARKTVMYAVVGLIVVALSQTLVKFVIDKIT